MYFNVSFGNVSMAIFITNEYPDNGSSIEILQPTVFFNLTNPTGQLMNYSIYIGNSSANTTTLLYNTTAVSNGTQIDPSHLYHTAVNYTSYWWRVEVNAGGGWVNGTFVFTIYAPIELVQPTPGFEIVLFLLSLIAIVYWRRKRR